MTFVYKLSIKKFLVSISKVIPCMHCIAEPRVQATARCMNIEQKGYIAFAGSGSARDG